MVWVGVNRRLYLVPQFFEHKPIERLIGPGITAENLNDDCLGRTLDWLTAHDLTALFVGLAYQARRRFGVAAEVVHVDSTSFAVEGAYEREEDEANEALIRITYGYSRDHRADLKQWQLSLATTTSGVPTGLQVLNGNASDRATLAEPLAEVVYQFRAEGEEEPIYVADSALYSEATMTDLEQKRVWWVSRVPETSSLAKALVAEEPAVWQGTAVLRWAEQEVSIGPRTERWIVVQSAEGIERQHATLQRRAEQDRQRWMKCLRELEQRTFACETDAQSALAEAKRGLPAWLEVDLGLHVSARYGGRGRPRTGVPPQQVWSVHGTISRCRGHASLLHFSPCPQDTDLIYSGSVRSFQRRPVQCSSGQASRVFSSISMSAPSCCQRTSLHRVSISPPPELYAEAN